MPDKKITELTAETDPIDTDLIGGVDITAGETKKFTWAGIKATLKAYFDTLYHGNDGDAAVGDVLSGKTFYSNNENKKTGTMTNVGAQSITPAAAGNAITAGYHNGSGGVVADADFIAANIKKDTVIWGITGTHEGNPSLENYTYVSDGTFKIYYKKYGKVYMILGGFEPNVYFPTFRGGNANGSEDTTTTNRICSLLGITKSSVVLLSELGDVSSQTLYGVRYYSGGVWNTENSTIYPLVAIVST